MFNIFRLNTSIASTMSQEEEPLRQTTVLLDVAPRLQWDHGNGYCGEVSLQSIGKIMALVIVIVEFSLFY